MLVDVDRGATVIPTSAIERGQQGAFVYVVGEDSKVSAKAVTLGPTEGEREAITSGVSPGDKVVVDGADRLKEGMEVVAQLQTHPGANAPGKSGSPDGENRHRKPSESN